MPRLPRTDRRQFLRASAALGAGTLVVPGALWARRRRSANDRLDVGVVGVANRGATNLGKMEGENVVALCDVDADHLAEGAERVPKAAQYRDFRRMIEREKLDAVVVSTPDHTHAVVTLAALDAGLHVYCEKPLTRTVREARRVAKEARASGLVTQMGIQKHAEPHYPRAVELLRSGAIGNVEAVHAFCGKGWWAAALPEGEEDVPDALDYDLWTGPVKKLPYHSGYHPANWRRYWNFGGGTLGDMACHYLDVAFWALELDHPAEVEAEGPPPHPDGAPEWLHVRWSFPKRGARGPVELHWHDGGKRPAVADELGVEESSGTLFVGSKGALFADYDGHRLLPEPDFEDFERPEPWLPDPTDHWREWREACRGNGATACGFDYAGPLTETVLLGAVAFRAGAQLTWDAETLTAAGAPGVEELVRGTFREGWGF